MFLIGVTIFTLASLLAGLAGDTATLISARALQGIGAALVAPASLSIIALMGAVLAASGGGAGQRPAAFVDGFSTAVTMAMMMGRMSHGGAQQDERSDRRL